MKSLPFHILNLIEHKRQPGFYESDFFDGPIERIRRKIEEISNRNRPEPQAHPPALSTTLETAVIPFKHRNILNYRKSLTALDLNLITLLDTSGSNPENLKQQALFVLEQCQCLYFISLIFKLYAIPLWEEVVAQKHPSIVKDAVFAKSKDTITRHLLFFDHFLKLLRS